MPSGLDSETEAKYVYADVNRINTTKRVTENLFPIKNFVDNFMNWRKLQSKKLLLYSVYYLLKTMLLRKLILNL